MLNDAKGSGQRDGSLFHSLDLIFTYAHVHITYEKKCLIRDETSGLIVSKAL